MNIYVVMRTSKQERLVNLVLIGGENEYSLKMEDVALKLGVLILVVEPYQ
jgi:hypothetical protein